MVLFLHLSPLLESLSAKFKTKKKGLTSLFLSIYKLVFTDLNRMEEDRKEKNTPWLSVPQFGDWDQKGGGTVPDYSMDFTKIREMRKQNKRDPSRASLDNEEDLVKPPESATTEATAKLTTVHSENHKEFSENHHHQPHSPSTRRSIFSCFNCCVKA